MNLLQITNPISVVKDTTIVENNLTIIEKAEQLFNMSWSDIISLVLEKLLSLGFKIGLAIIVFIIGK